MLTRCLCTFNGQVKLASFVQLFGFAAGASSGWIFALCRACRLCRLSQTANAVMSHNKGPGELALFRMDQLECIDAKSLPNHEESLFPNWLCFAFFSYRPLVPCRFSDAHVS